MEDGETRGGVRFARLEDYDGAAGFVVGGVEPVAEGKHAGGVRGILRFIVEVVDGDGEVAGWVEEGWVDVRGGLASEEVRSGMAVSLESVSIALGRDVGGWVCTVQLLV